MESAPTLAPVSTSRAAATLRAIRIVWYRDLIRFWKDKTRMVSSLVQPILYLFVLGTGFTSLLNGAGSSSTANNLRPMFFPGVLVLGVVFTAMFSAGSIVWDREFGFLREMLVAPIGRAAIVIGKCVGGATVATLQGSILIAICGLIGVPYDPLLILELVAMLLLLSFSMTAFGILMASRMKNIQSFFGLMQLIIMPMFFLSGALYPLSGLPDWLSVITRFNPVSYAVDPLRQAVLAHVNAGPLAPVFGGGITWFGWRVPIIVDIAIVACVGLLMLAGAVAQFRRSD